MSEIKHGARALVNAHQTPTILTKTNNSTNWTLH